MEPLTHLDHWRYLNVKKRTDPALFTRVTKGLGVQETDLFILLATSGLVVQFGLQAVINMGSTLRLMPTKGMTLPFVSYGGSSLIAMGLCIGFLLALTRRRVGAGVQR